MKGMTVAVQSRTLLVMDGQRRPKKMELLYPWNPPEPRGELAPLKPFYCAAPSTL